MRILVVSGSYGIKALEELKRIFPEIFPEDIDLEYLCITDGIISFTSSRHVERLVESKVKSGRYDIVILPYIFSIKLDNVKIVRLKHVGDIPAFLKYIKECNDIPDDISELYIRMMRYLHEVESFVISNSYRFKNYKAIFGRNCRFRTNGLPPLIVAEIVDAVNLDMDTCIEIAHRYVSEGASIIDVGCIAGNPKPENVYRVITKLRDVLPSNVGISVDTLSPMEIEAAIKADVDLILSVTRSTIEKVSGDLKDVGVVIVPDCELQDHQLANYFQECIKVVENRGGIPIIDPLLSPPLINLTRSICRYVVLREKLPERPMLMGFGNVVELIDADCVGIYAILAVLATELEIDLVLTTEASKKTQGCISYLKKALHMTTAAKLLSKYPKDMSISLLELKSKW